MVMTADDYLRQLQALLPPGAALTLEPDGILTKFLHGLAEELARVDSRGGDLVDQVDPRTSDELLGEWETLLGLPDTCAAALVTLAERQAAAFARLIASGGSSRAYFAAICASLGLAVTIEEFRPFVCALSRCGDALNGPATVRHIWRVTVPGAENSYLTCLLERLKPAHTNLVIVFEGA